MNLNSYFMLNFCYPVCVKSFNVLLTKRVGVYGGGVAHVTVPDYAAR